MSSKCPTVMVGQYTENSMSAFRCSMRLHLLLSWRCLVEMLVLVLASFLVSTVNAAPVSLVTGGKANGVILIPAESPGSVQLAAKELQVHVKRMTGVELKIHQEQEVNLDTVVVSLGQTELAERNGVNSYSLASDGFRIKEASGVMFILGRDYNGPILGDRRGRSNRTYNRDLKINVHGETGTQNGVYHFLRKKGVRWYMPGDIGVVVPKMSSLAYDGIAIEDAPFYSYRVLQGFDFNQDPDAALWYKRVGYGSVRYININHSFTDWAYRFGKTNPEYFAEIDGVSHLKTVKDPRRIILDYSEPGVLNQVISDADTFFDGNPEEDIFPVVPNDSHVAHDESAETKKSIISPQYSSGWLSEIVWGFVNKVAIGVRKNHPEKQVGGLAYSYQFNAPVMLDRFSPNVVVMHSQQRRRFWNEEYKNRVRDSLAAFKRLKPVKQYVWEYYNLRSTNESLRWLPYVMPHTIAEDLKALKPYSSGEFIQARQSKETWTLDYPAYYHVNLYTTARLLWDPDEDVDSLLSEYYRLYYGPAAKPMSEFWGRLELIWSSQVKDYEDMEKVPLHRRHKNRKLLPKYFWQVLYTPKVVDELFSFLESALELSVNQGDYQRRVELIRREFGHFKKMSYSFNGLNISEK